MGESQEPVYDWDAIELDYRAGVMTLTELCRRHKVGIKRLADIVDKRRWTRMPKEPVNLAPPPSKNTQFPATAARVVGDSIFTGEEVKKYALMQAGAIVETHRKDIKRLREMTEEVMRRGAILLGLEPGHEGDPLPVLGGRESISDLLVKASTVLTRTIELERQAYGLTVLPPGTDPEGEQILPKDRLDALIEQLNSISYSKRKEAEDAKLIEGTATEEK